MDLISLFRDLVAQVPEILQPLIIALAGAVPFIEGEGAASIGILGGLNPVVATIAAAAGNFACVAVLVLVSSGARSAIVNRRAAKREARVGSRDAVLAGAPGAPRDGASARPVDGGLAGGGLAGIGLDSSSLDGSAEADAAPAESARKAARRAKFQRALERYGVPGVSLLGPLLLPTQFTATMLAAAGVKKARVLFWQAVAIAGWTTLVAVVISGVVHVVH
jgi:hypothetical protein